MAQQQLETDVFNQLS